MKLVVRVAVVTLFLTLACGRTSVGPQTPCEGTLCPRGYVCDVADGTCKTPELVVGADAGNPDAGPFLDAGLPPDDGGTDAGTDAGSVPCPNGCAPNQVCDEAANGGAGACVTCTLNGGCAAPTPACDISVPGGQCVGCTRELDCQSPTPTCDLATKTCVECTDAVHCGLAAPACDLKKNVCVECLGNQDCSAPNPVCDVKAQTCRGCLTGSDCANPTPVCQMMTQQCVGCTSTSQCPGATVCSGGACIGVPDTCAVAQDITFAPGATTASFQTDTTTATDNDIGTCNPQGGRDLVYKLTVGALSDLTITVTRPMGSSANPAVYVRSMSCAGSQIACANMSNTTETVALKPLPAGDYFIFIESTGGSAGILNVQVSLTPAAPPPANDTCMSAQILTFTNGAATVTGSTENANNSNAPNAQTPTCSTSARQSGGDVIYELTLTQAQDVALTVTATGANPTFRPAMYVRGPSTTNACTSDTERACVSAGTGTIVPQSILLPNLAAGTYFVWVDSVINTSGPFQLDVKLSLPTTNNTCASPRALVFTNGVATDSGDTRFATNSNNGADTSPTCSTSAKQSGQDVVFSYSLMSPQDVTLTVTPTGMAPTFQPVMYVRASQCGVTTGAVERGCITNFSATPQTMTLYNQPAGLYFVWIDGAQQTAGPFDLEVTLSPPTPPPSNDTCAAPVLLAVGSPVLGDTTTATDNYSRTSMPAYGAACLNNNPLSFTGKDVVYQFIATATQHTVTLTPGNTFDSALMILQPVCGPGACTTFEDNQGFGIPETITLNTMVGNTYFLVVEGFNAQQSGAFVIGVN